MQTSLIAVTFHDKIFKRRISLTTRVTLSVAGWEHPELFYLLPCRFNSQTSVQYLKPPWEETFEQYHHCTNRSHIVISHR